MSSFERNKILDEVLEGRRISNKVNLQHEIEKQQRAQPMGRITTLARKMVVEQTRTQLHSLIIKSNSGFITVDERVSIETINKNHPLNNVRFQFEKAIVNINYIIEIS
jgi:hypothetical protein